MRNIHPDDDTHLASPAEAMAEYAINAGRDQPDRAWILTPWDVWQKNPMYIGPPVPHPEDDAAVDEYSSGEWENLCETAYLTSPDLTPTRTTATQSASSTEQIKDYSAEIAAETRAKPKPAREHSKF